VFTDTEPSLNNFTYAIQNRLYILFIDNIITPVFYKHDYGKKHVRVDSFKELAYLHPKYFHPNDDVFKYLGIDKSEAYILLRFNSFDAVHDTGLNGFTTEDKIRLIKELEKKARVFISSESAIPDQISSYRLNAPRSRIHDIIYFSKLLVADTGTMVTEAAILGVPSIMMHPKALVFGNFDELEKRYGLVHCYDEFSEDVIEKANDLVNGSMVKEEWEEKREKLLNDKTDMVSFYIDYIVEHYGGDVGND